MNGKKKISVGGLYCPLGEACKEIVDRGVVTYVSHALTVVHQVLGSITLFDIIIPLIRPIFSYRAFQKHL